MQFMKCMAHLLAIVLALLLPLVARADGSAPAAQQEWWQALLAWLMPIVGSIVTLVLATLVGSLLRKWKINIDQGLIDKAVGAGVSFAEGKAMSALNAGSQKTPGAEKMDMALAVAKQLMEQYKLRKLAEDKLKSLIEAKLGEAKAEEKKALLSTVASIPKDGTPAIKIPGWAQ